MATCGPIRSMLSSCFFLFLLSETCMASYQNPGKIDRPFQGSQMNYIDNDGNFLVSNDSGFGFGFRPTDYDVQLFLLVVIHVSTSRIIWTANRGSPVQNSDKFVFDDNGKVFLQKGSGTVWSADTNGKAVSAIELHDSGNLVLVGNDNQTIWESFHHPTNTLLSYQNFSEGMKLESDPADDNTSYYLEIKSGDMMLYAGYRTPQPYWSMKNEKLKITEREGNASLASIEGNSWRFYDRNNILLWQYVLTQSTDANSIWVATLGSDGIITFSTLSGGDTSQVQKKIPGDSCSTPGFCDAYYVCSSNRCQCPSVLSSRPNCKTGIVSPCEDSTELANAGDGFNYFAIGFVSPSLPDTDLNGCKNSCLSNCSCLALFFNNSTGNCFQFDRVGGLQSNDGLGYAMFIKVSVSGGGDANEGDGGGSSKKHFPYVVIIAVFTVLVIVGLVYGGYRYSRRKGTSESHHDQSSEEDNFLETLSGMPIRFTYKDLQTATDNFSQKLGQGGFGSVYRGVLPDGTRLAVKKLEGIGQGKKEFRAEVSIIGSIHHLHLVRLKGFCAEGSHRLLAYEYMANGSLERWIFKRNKEGFMLDWNTRFNIALGTAKGLAYLHEDCDAKIVHCDIKPENVLLDDNYLAKVSDFGLAKLMTREQSHVFTTMRGTRGYLAPEWITNYAISEKSDVYSYGMVLLEIIGGRKNYDPNMISEKSHFPTYAFKMMEEGKLRDILDSQLEVDEEDDRVATAIKVAMWCVQEDMHQRPSMMKVVQMLEGLCAVPQPPTISQMGSRLYSGFFKSISEEGTSSGPSDCNSDAHLSAVRLSGPR